MSRMADFIKGLSGLFATILLVFGVPAALIVVVGYPWPAEAPNFDLIRNHITEGNIPAEFIIKSLAVILWIVWFQLTVAVLTEILAVMRNRRAATAPVMPGFQWAARKFVASAVLLIAALGPARPGSAAALAPIDAETVNPIDFDTFQPYAAQGFVSTGGDAEAAAKKAISPAGQYETRNGDNWWDIAERVLGDGMRWSELRELNEGTVQLDGETITSRTETTRPGWRLNVPEDANASVLSPFLAAESAPSTNGDSPYESEYADNLLVHAVKPELLIYEGPTGVFYAGGGVPYQIVEGDNLWDIAERHLGDPFRWPEIYELSADLEQPFGRTITDPNLILPNELLRLPADAVNVPTASPELVDQVLGTVELDELPSASPEAVEEATQDAGFVGLPGPVSAVKNPNGSGPGPDGGPIAGRYFDPPQGVGDLIATPQGFGFGVGGLLVASGLLGLLERKRRLRQSQAAANSMVAPTPLELVDIETVLRNNASSKMSLSIHTIVDSLSARKIVPGEPVAAPEVVRISSDRVEVIQNSADPDLPSPWMPMEAPAVRELYDRSAAVLPAEFFPEEGKVDPTSIAAPTFVTIGGGLLLNLEAVGVVGIDGPIELSAGLTRSLVHELATGPARRNIDIRVSQSLPGAEMHHHVRCGPMSGIADELDAWLTEVDLTLTASGFSSPYAMRATGARNDLIDPKVIFADISELDEIEPLMRRARQQSAPLAVVIAGQDLSEVVSVDVTLKLGVETLTIEPYGFQAAMQYIDLDLLLGVQSLIKHAEAAPLVHRPDEIEGLMPIEDIDTDPASAITEETPEAEVETERPDGRDEMTDRSPQPDGGLLVRVLGPVAVEGTDTEFTQEELSVISFISLSGPSTQESLINAVWPGDEAAVESLEATVAGLKAKLGKLMVDSTDGRYRLRSVVSDLGLARRWLAQARGMSADRARNLMQLGLSEVRGNLFGEVEERFWQWTADHQLAVKTQASAMLIDACFDLCDSAYDANDPELAKWACEVGSSIDPMNETLLTRRVQLLLEANSMEEAEMLVSYWENYYRDATGVAPPARPRAALESAATGSYVS